MRELMETNLLGKLLRKIAPTSLKKLSEVPPKAPGSKALARWLTVRIAEISNLANPRLNLANACSPWALCGTVYIREKIFCEPEPSNDFNCEPGCEKCGQFDCICVSEEEELPEEPKEFEIPICES